MGAVWMYIAVERLSIKTLAAFEVLTIVSLSVRRHLALLRAPGAVAI